MSEPLKQRYGQLCQELGHLTCNLELLQKRIAEIKTEIFGLNMCAPLMKTMEPVNKTPPVTGTTATIGQAEHKPTGIIR